MDDELCASQGERRGVVIEIPVHLCIPRKFGVHARLLEQVEREDGVLDKSAPEMKQEVLVSTKIPAMKCSLKVLIARSAEFLQWM